MGYSRYDPAMQEQAPWNAGRKVGTKRPLTQKQICAVRFFLDRKGRLRDLDLVKIKIGNLVAGPEMRKRATVTQQKTWRPVQFELTSDVRASLFPWFERRGERWNTVPFLAG